MSNSLLNNYLYAWYESNRRVLPWRETENPYFIWLSEIILQQTRVAQGMDYYLRFINRWPRVEDLASAEEADVLREWQGLGYYSRARHLHEAAKMIVARGWSPFPAEWDAIRSLPGVGEYTAGAIASFAYDMPYPAMDGNVYRVVARLMDIDEPFDTTAGKKLFHRRIEELLDHTHPRLFNSAIMEFGALYCTPLLGDRCDTCPLRSLCASHVHGTSELLPVRKPRPKLKDRWLDYRIYLAQENGQVYTLLHRRTEKDIWLHLYEFVLTEYADESSWIKVGSGKQGGGRREPSNPVCREMTHVLSHQRLHVRFTIHQVAQLPVIPATIRVAWNELDTYALSRLTLRFLDSLA